MTVIGQIAYNKCCTNARHTFKISTCVAGAISSWNDARMTRNALSQLSTRELEDIGLVRSDIDKISRR